MSGSLYRLTKCSETYTVWSSWLVRISSLHFQKVCTLYIITYIYPWTVWDQTPKLCPPTCQVLATVFKTFDSPGCKKLEWKCLLIWRTNLDKLGVPLSRDIQNLLCFIQKHRRKKKVLNWFSWKCVKLIQFNTLPQIVSNCLTEEPWICTKIWRVVGQNFEIWNHFTTCFCKCVHKYM